MSEEIYKCDECNGDRFFKYKMDRFDAWDFDHIIQLDGTFCKGCVYKLLYEHCREKVWKMEDFIEDW